MGVRTEAIRLQVIDDASTPMAKFAATTALARRELRGLDGSASSAAPSLTRVANEANQVERSLDGVTTTARRGSSGIDQYSVRLSLLVKGLTAIGPAAAPISAIAVPALAALSEMAGTAVLGIGATVLAFRGVGDALKALDAAQLEPTVANLQKAREAMDQLSPAAQRFVLELDAAEPALKKLSQSAARGLFPGLTEGMQGALTVLPQARGLIEDVAGAVGNLGEMTGDSLASGDWAEFLTFLRAEAPPTIETMGRSVGNLTKGLAQLWMAFAPLNTDVIGWLEDGSQAFEDWATGLDQTQGFTEFVDYVRTSGPQVAAAAGAIGNAILQIGEAAAPLGGPTLEVLTTLANLISTIADSPIGTPLAALATAASALSLLNKGLASTQGFMRGVLSGGAGPSGADQGGGIGSFFQDNADQVRDAAGQMRTDFAAVRSTLRSSLGAGLAPTSGQLMTLNNRMRAVAGSAARMGAAVGRSAAPMAGMALAATDIDDQLGVSNTAMLTLMGTMAGPWGAAAGFVVGGFMDISSAGDSANASILDLNKTIAAGDFTALGGQIGDAKAQMADLGNVSGVGDLFSDLAGRASMNLNGGSDAFKQQIHDAEEANEAITRLRDAIGGTGSLNEAVASAGPSMAALGISLKDLTTAKPDELDGLLNQIANYQNVAGTAAGRTAALNDAFHGLDDGMLSVEERAKQVSSALDALLSPQLNLSQATDQYRAGLRNLRDDLDKTNRSLTGQTNAADTNRAAIRKQVQNVQALIDAQAASGASGETMTRTLRNSRKAIMDAGQAAGLSRREVRDYINTLGLTPRTVETLVKANTDSAMAALRAIQAYRIADKSFTVTQYTNATLADAKVSGKGKAAGGPIYGPGTKTSDSVPIMASNGEFMMRAAAVEHYGMSLFQDLNAKRLATGGPVDDDASDDPKDRQRTARQIAADRKRAASRAKERSRARNAYSDLDIDTGINAEGVSQALDEFADDIKRIKGLYKDAGLSLTKAQRHQVDDMRGAAREFDRLTSTVKATREAQAAYQQQVAGSINNDIFGNGLAGLTTQLDADTNDNNSMLTALAQAALEGLDGPLFQALAASGDVATAQQLAAAGAGTIATTEAKFGGRAGSQQALAGFAGQQVFGAQLQANTAQALAQTQAINRMEKAISRMGGQVRDGARDGSHSGTKQGNAEAVVTKNQKSGQRAKTQRRGGR